MHTLDSGFFRALLSYHIHQDRLVWGRVNLLILVQGGLLYAGFAQRWSNLGTVIMISGAIFLFILFVIALRDRDAREVNELLLYKLADKCVPDGIKFSIRKELRELEKTVKELEIKINKNKLNKDDKKQLQDDKKRLHALKPYGKRFFFFVHPEEKKWKKMVGGTRTMNTLMLAFIIMDIYLACAYFQLHCEFPRQLWWW